jgi:Spy/CpxP family protein refolding chaperone
MKKSTFAIILVLLSITLIGSIIAHPGCGEGKGERPESGEMFRMKDFREEIGLSDQQLAKIEEMKYQRRLSAIDLRASLEKERLEMEKLMADAKFDRNKIFKQAEKVAELEKQMTLARIQGRLDMMELLTAEQRDKIKDMRHERPMMRRSKEGDRDDRPGKPQGDRPKFDK